VLVIVTVTVVIRFKGLHVAMVDTLICSYVVFATKKEKKAYNMETNSSTIHLLPQL
jgi:hypothetical protein